MYFISSKTEGSHQTHAKENFVEKWKNVLRCLREVDALKKQKKIIDISPGNPNIDVCTGIYLFIFIRRRIKKYIHANT